MSRAIDFLLADISALAFYKLRCNQSDIAFYESECRRWAAVVITEATSGRPAP